jgi:hypothetical protein
VGNIDKSEHQCDNQSINESINESMIIYGKMKGTKHHKTQVSIPKNRFPLQIHQNFMENCMRTAQARQELPKMV